MLCDIGHTFCGLTGKTSDDFGSGAPYITYVNVYKNQVLEENGIGYVKIAASETQNILKYGDAVFTISSETPDEVGTGAVYLSKKMHYLNSFCMGFRLKNFSTITPNYFAYLFTSKQFRKFVFPLAQGSTRYNLCRADFIKKKLPIPSIYSQIKLINVLDCLTKKSKSEKQMLINMIMQKKHLLYNLFI